MATHEVEITPDVLDAMNTGKHDLATVKHARRVLEAAGLTVRKHSYERQEAIRLRDLARKTLAEADKLDGKVTGVQEFEQND